MQLRIFQQYITKCHTRFSDEMTIVLYHRYQTVGVNLGEKPVWFLLQVNIHLLVWNLLGCQNKTDSLDNAENGESKYFLHKKKKAQMHRSLNEIVTNLRKWTDWITVHPNRYII